MKTKNCETRMPDRDKALLEYFDEKYKEFNQERNKLPERFQKSLSNKVVYTQTADKFFISETRVRVIVSKYRGRNRQHIKGEFQEA